MQLKVDFSQLVTATAPLKKAKQWLPAMVHKRMRTLGHDVEKSMKSELHKTFYTGQLMDSVKSDYNESNYTATIGPDLKRGQYSAGAILEYGTVPIPNVPWKPIVAWAERRGFDNPFMLVKKIRREGVKGHMFLESTMLRNDFSKALGNAVNDIGLHTSQNVFQNGAGPSITAGT